VSFLIPQGGFQTPLGVIADSLYRADPTAHATTLSIQMPAIDTAGANLLDLIIDGGDGASSGTLRMGNYTNGLVDLSYLVPVGAHC